MTMTDTNTKGQIAAVRLYTVGELYEIQGAGWEKVKEDQIGEAYNFLNEGASEEVITYLQGIGQSGLSIVWNDRGEFFHLAGEMNASEETQALNFMIGGPAFSVVKVSEPTRWTSLRFAPIDSVKGWELDLDEDFQDHALRDALAKELDQIEEKAKKIYFDASDWSGTDLDDWILYNVNDWNGGAAVYTINGINMENYIEA